MWKGKERATASDSDPEFLDLDPTITYRHLQSHALGVRDPLRVIALCDSDAFYAGCEMVRLKVDPEQPLVVSQWDSIIAVNYPSRKFGITRMDKVKDAQKRCPNLMVVHVATYREGDAEPGYWENPDTKTHKVGFTNRTHSPTLTYGFRSPWISTAERATKFIMHSRNPYRLALSLVRAGSVMSLSMLSEDSFYREGFY